MVRPIIVALQTQGEMNAPFLLESPLLSIGMLLSFGVLSFLQVLLGVMERKYYYIYGLKFYLKSYFNRN